MYVSSSFTSGMYNRFVIAARITFIVMNYSRLWIQDILIFCIASVLLHHTGPSLPPRVYLADFLLSIRTQ